jgi:hypothetical protein
MTKTRSAEPGLLESTPAQAPSQRRKLPLVLSEETANIPERPGTILTFQTGHIPDSLQMRPVCRI